MDAAGAIKNNRACCFFVKASGNACISIFCGIRINKVLLTG